MLLQLMTLIHLNFFKFKHKNERIKARKITLMLVEKELGFGSMGGTGLAHQKPMGGWFLLQFLSTFSLCSPSSKTDWSHQNSPKILLSLFPLVKPVLALKFGAKFSPPKFWNSFVKLRLMAANWKLRDEKFQFGSTRDVRIFEKEDWEKNFP